jgi:ankyrin repeat protein
LIEKGKISINKVNQAGCSSLHIAAEHNYLEIVKLFLEKGADVNIKV